MTESILLDAAGRRRSPATMPDFHRGRPPRNKGLQYPADPPTVEEIVAVMRCAGDQPYGLRTRAIVLGHHVDLPAGDRQQRDHRYRQPPPRSDASRQRRTPLAEVVQSGSVQAAARGVRIHAVAVNGDRLAA